MLTGRDVRLVRFEGCARGRVLDGEKSVGMRYGHRGPLHVKQPSLSLQSAFLSSSLYPCVRAGVPAACVTHQNQIPQHCRVKCCGGARGPNIDA